MVFHWGKGWNSVISVISIADIYGAISDIYIYVYLYILYIMYIYIYL